MSVSVLTRPELFGLYELAPDGTVLYYKAGAGSKTLAGAEDFVGLNFFAAIADLENVKEFQLRFESFAKGFQSVDSFTFGNSLNENLKPVKVMLVRLSEGNKHELTKLVIVDIRQA
jgi:hypothetical protein